MNLNPIFKKIDDIKLELDKLKDEIKSDIRNHTDVYLRSGRFNITFKKRTNNNKNKTL